ncbi:MAG TPA: thiamine-phosphate kinase [Planctomycetota bacterium]
MATMGWNEAELLRWLARRPRPARVRGSWGHDAAVLHGLRGDPVVCADQVVEGVHAERGTSGRHLGRKAAGRALSDLAATGAEPVALLLCLAAPRSEGAARLRAVITAVDAKGREHGAPLVGGDLAGTRGALRLAVTALGRFPARRRPPGRDRARPGDLVLLSGPTGGSRRGRHLDPRPRLELGRCLAAHGVHALMDVSDGLALDLARLARASGVRIDLERVPVHRDALLLTGGDARRARRRALDDGEDHELLATLPRAAWAVLERRLRRRFAGLEVVGRVRRGHGLWLATEDGGRLAPWSGAGGFVHGA